MQTNQKKCFNCNQDLPITKFSKKGNSIQSMCVDCYHILHVETYVPIKKVVKVKPFEAKCTRCGEMKNVEFFSGRHRVCNPCQADKRQDRRELVAAMPTTDIDGNLLTQMCKGKCGKMMLITAFLSENGGRVYHDCPDCRKEERKKTTYPRQVEPKWCPNCQEYHPASHFYGDKYQQSGLQTNCKKSTSKKRQTQA